jgi:hypothetical protein
VCGLEVRVKGLGFWVFGFGFGVVFRVQGFGFRV